MENVFESFTITILKLNKLVQKIKNFEMREYGLKTIHVMCVYYLKNHSDGLTASELSKFTLEDKAAISRALRILQGQGYVDYDANGYNAPIRLTASGAELAKHISEKAEKAVEAGSYDFDEVQRKQFYVALDTIAHNLEQYYSQLTKN